MTENIKGTTYNTKNFWRIAVVVGVVIISSIGWKLFADQNVLERFNTSPVDHKHAVPLLKVKFVKVKGVTSYVTTHSYTGKIVARRRSQIGFEVQGRVKTLTVDEGDKVYADKVLGNVEDDRLQNQYQQVKAQVDQATAMLAELKNGSRKEDILAVTHQIAELEAEQIRLASTLERQTKLFEKKVISQDAYETAFYAKKAVDEKLKSLDANLLKLNNGPRQEKIDAQAAVLAQLKQNLSGIEIDIKDCELKSPYAGIITKRFRDEGDVITQGTPVFEVVETGFLEIKVGLPPASVSALLTLNEVDVETSTGKIKAIVKSVVPEVDPRTRTQLVILKILDKYNDKCVIEDIVRISLPETVNTAGYWVPTAALFQAGKGLFACYVIEENKETNTSIARKRLIETLYVDGERTLVRGTLKDGESIITTGVLKIVDGQIIKPEN